MKYLNMTFIFVSLIFLFSCGALEEKQKGNNPDENKGNAVEDSTVVEQKDSVEQKVVVVSEEENNDNVEATKKKYYVIVGSFKKETNAKDLHKKLVKSGAPSELLEADNNFNRVSKKAFDTKEEALEELKKVQTKDKQLDAWLLTK